MSSKKYTVKELISELQKIDPSFKVEVSFSYDIDIEVFEDEQRLEITSRIPIRI